jgi:DNA-binding MarR family transcriptional regulator
MTDTSPSDLRALLDRITRLSAADAWSEQLNPAQMATLEYLARANRFSRAPSHVADYLGTTRGTVSQTLKALERKGYVTETRSSTDKRRTSYSLTQSGAEAVAEDQDIQQVLAALPPSTRAGLEAGLRSVLAGLLARRQGRSFGLCRTCKHHATGPDGPQCRLLNIALSTEEPNQICHEHAA